MPSVKQHKDKIFLFAMIITLGNVIYWTFYRIVYLAGNIKVINVGNILENVLIILSGGIAIWAILYLIRQNHKRNKALKEQANKEQVSTTN